MAGWGTVTPPSRGNGLALGDVPWVERVEFDPGGNAGDGGLSGFAGGVAAALLGLAGAGAAGAVADGEAGHEGFQEEGGEREMQLLRGGKPRRCRSRLPGRAGS